MILNVTAVTPYFDMLNAFMLSVVLLSAVAPFFVFTVEKGYLTTFEINQKNFSSFGNYDEKNRGSIHKKSYDNF